MTKTILVLSMLAVVPSLGVGVVWHTNKNANAISQHTQTVALTTAAGPAKVFAQGIVEGRHREVPLRFELAGRLASIEVAEGDQVRKGQVLARLDATVWRHELSKAQADLAAAQADKRRLEAGATPQARARARAEVTAAKALTSLTKSRFERVAKLAGTQAVAEQDLDDALGRHRIAVAEWEAARAGLADLEAPPRPHEIQAADAEIALQTAQVDRARAMLAKTELLAPSDGLVLLIRGEPGETADPASRDAIVTLVDLSEICVRAFVEELDALRVAPGYKAYATADGMPGRAFHGTVKTCLPCLRAKSHFNHRADERHDVKVREVLIQVKDPQALELLVVGLPVDVFIESQYITANETERPFGSPESHDVNLAQVD